MTERLRSERGGAGSLHGRTAVLCSVEEEAPKKKQLNVSLTELRQRADFLWRSIVTKIKHCQKIATSASSPAS